MTAMALRPGLPAAGHVTERNTRRGSEGIVRQTPGVIRKAVIPAAGLGTRFLPATKALPKEMLPVVDKPAIQYVVEEAVRAELTQILMVTGRNKTALENHFDRAVELEGVLAEKGDLRRLRQVSRSTDLANIHYLRQHDPHGLGHAVLVAEYFVGSEPFVVLLGDEIIPADEQLLPDMMRLAQLYQANVVALIEVPDEAVGRYGIAEPADPITPHPRRPRAPGVTGTAEPAGSSPPDRMGEPTVLRLSGFVEKPALADAPSRLAILGRYVLQPGVFDVLRQTPAGRGGEIQLTDALTAMARDSRLAGEVLGVVFTGRSFDTGDKLSYLKAIIELALDRPDLGPELEAWLRAGKYQRSETQS